MKKKKKKKKKKKCEKIKLEEEFFGVLLFINKMCLFWK
jgi:hypothetical protein